MTVATSNGRAPTADVHAAPLAGERCDLWVTLKTREAGTGARLSLSSRRPLLFLHFRASGLLVALPDEDPALLDADSEMVSLRLRSTDAIGLGLTPADFADGIGLCGGAFLGEQAGWRCRNVAIVSADDDGQERPLDTPTLVEAWLR
jgi:hypothetical protein